MLKGRSGVVLMSCCELHNRHWCWLAYISAVSVPGRYCSSSFLSANCKLLISQSSFYLSHFMPACSSLISTLLGSHAFLQHEENLLSVDPLFRSCPLQRQQRVGLAWDFSFGHSWLTYCFYARGYFTWNSVSEHFGSFVGWKLLVQFECWLESVAVFLTQWWGGGC